MIKILWARLHLMLGGKMLSNVASLAILQVVNYLLPIITLPYLVRTLKLAHYGELNFSLAFIQYFLMLTSYGFSLSGTRAVARSVENRGEVSKIFWSISAGKLLLAVAGLVLLLVLIQAVPLLHGAWPILLAGYTIVLADVLLPTWLLQGVEQMGLMTTCVIIAKSLAIPSTFILVRHESDAWIAALIQGITGILAGVLSLLAVHRRGLVGWVRPTVASIRHHLSDGWHIFLSNAAVSLYTSTTLVLLGFLAGNVTVGEFAAADKVRQAIQSLTSPISTAAYPRICVLIHQDRDKGFSFIRLLMLGQGGVTLMLSAATLILASPIIHQIYGARYENAIDCLRWLALLPFVISLSNIFGVQTMLPLGMKKSFSNILIMSGVLNVGLVLLLAKPYEAVGAAIALLITETLITLAMAALLMRRRIPIFRLT